MFIQLYTENKQTQTPDISVRTLSINCKIQRNAVQNSKYR